MDGEEPDSPVVLVVENEPGLVELYELWLGDDYEVRTAHDAREAFDAVDDAVTVVLLDRLLPGVSGDEVLERIREEVDCPVAMVTAVPPDFELLELGFDTYVQKPVTRASLRETVDELVTLAGYDREIQEYYALVSKKRVLETQKNARELESCETYAALDTEIRELRARLDATQPTVFDQALEHVFRKLH